MFRKSMALLLLAVFCLAVITGCGVSSKKSEMVNDSSPAMDMARGDTNVQVTFSKSTNGAAEPQSGAPAAEMEQPAAIMGSGTGAQASVNTILAQRKIIRNANIVLEVDDFEAAYIHLKTLIEPHGFIQESSVKKEKQYYGAEEKLVTRGIIVLRVDRTRFDSILDGIKGLGLLMDMSIKSEDVTDKFFDVDSQLRLLRYEQQRLEQYLLKSDHPDTIFKTESRLTEIRHQIESLTGTLNKLSDLVQLSTITVSIHEKGRDASAPPKQKTYWDKLADSFSGSVKGVVVFLGELLILFVQSIPALILLALSGVLLRVFYRRFFKNRVKPPKKEDQNL